MGYLYKSCVAAVSYHFWSIHFYYCGCPLIMSLTSLWIQNLSCTNSTLRLIFKLVKIIQVKNVKVEALVITNFLIEIVK